MQQRSLLLAILGLCAACGNGGGHPHDMIIVIPPDMAVGPPPPPPSPPPPLPPDGGGPPPDLSVGSQGVGPNGGSVDKLFFAVIGDTRPGSLDATAQYPTAVIQKIYADIQDMRPRPQFVIATGDYQYANPKGTEGAAQLSLYQKAQQQYTGTVFAAMGNHECNGYTADNCTSPTNNLMAYLDTLVKPLGKDLPYYSVPINATDKSWSAKVLIVACNAWSDAQNSWLTGELAKPTTYTFVVRHQPAHADTGPCVSAAEGLLASNPYNLSIVGHTHHFAASGKEIIVGNGGAPLSGGTFGFATVQQTDAGFVITNYDYATGGAISMTTVPF